MSTHTYTDTQTWFVDGTDSCDIPDCRHQPVIIAGGGWHDKFCDLHLSTAVDFALRFPAFPGWYRVEDLTTNSSQVTVVVHSLT